MNDSLFAAARDALTLLTRLREERVDIDDAHDSLRQLGERHPDHWMDIVWEKETFEDVMHYDILLADEGGTYSLSYCADGELPWPVRGLQRINEALVLRVDNIPVRISEVINSLDYAWHKLHIGRHLIDTALIHKAVHDRGIDATDQELAQKLDAFRDRRRLFSVAEFERWMAEHGTTQVQLERQLHREVTCDKLRRQVTEDRVKEYFESHQEDFDRVQVARLHVPDQATAMRLHEDLRAQPDRLLSVAKDRFLDTGHVGGELLSTLVRGQLEPDQAAVILATEPGQLTRPVPSGDGWEILQVLRVVPAAVDAWEGDSDIRDLIEDRLFAEWLADKRQAARIEWFWGESEAAQVPAMSI